eukprot:CAMPEP_0204523872 /NCGR_PEP_ID=MMETSP0661-20131031/7074_1 /ASSEMBLY_ACC=CAM_ASM_000606 /TAXON_ID=109239 /ORGANISM="Alexandrium margalefi, Strain AMGDE01CS-322" /LENGTH=503 /DNA_ID=CAMNT_0051529597 /DNA_START=61 /DNA_END=1573 /DNA_ORIENTATION=+
MAATYVVLLTAVVLPLTRAQPRHLQAVITKHGALLASHDDEVRVRGQRTTGSSDGARARANRTVGGYCCFSSKDTTSDESKCKTCFSGSRSKTGEYCHNSEKCKACNADAVWCDGSGSEGTDQEADADNDKDEQQGGYCCFCSKDNSSDVSKCNTCFPGSKSKTGTPCHDEKMCKECDADAAWCDGSGGGGADQEADANNDKEHSSKKSDTESKKETGHDTESEKETSKKSGEKSDTESKKAPGEWMTGMTLTHYWDCNGQSCDSKTLQPWDPSKAKFVAAPGYAPQDPDAHGGAEYGEKIWFTGAPSEFASRMLGDSDGCCGDTDHGEHGCGKCFLVQNPHAVNADWTVIIMKKNVCVMGSPHCGEGEANFDIAVPGFDNLGASQSNACADRPKTGFKDKKASTILGSWWDECDDLTQCAHKCSQMPDELAKGCKLFCEWGWKKTGFVTDAKYKAVDCPEAFKKWVGAQFDANGVVESSEAGGLAPQWARRPMRARPPAQLH